MNKLSLSLIAALFVPMTAMASDLNVSVKSGGQSTIKVFPGQTISYEVTGELSDALNSGLAYFSFDLEFEGGPLTQAASPTSNPMLNFATPQGLNNPAGFGGTLSGGKLLQVGGLQNTWNNTFASAPIGTVITDVAKPGSPATLVTGNVTAPNKVGTFKLRVKNLDANVVKAGETGLPFWATERAPAGSNSELTIQVSALSGNVATLSISNPSAQTLSLNAGPQNAGRTYWMLGSLSGTAPGVFLNLGVKLPLNYDTYFAFLLSSPNPSFLPNSVGVLDAQGKKTLTFTLPPSLRPALAGRTINHAYFLTPTNDFASDAASVTLTP